MKKLFILLILAISQLTNAQQSEFVVEHCTKLDTYKAPMGLICSNENKTKWFAMFPTYAASTTKPIPNGVSIIMMNIGKATQNDRLIIRFSDGETIVLNAYSVIPEYYNMIMFEATVRQIQVMKNYVIKSIKYLNGGDGQTFTYYPEYNEKVFFINAFNNFIVKDVNCN
jgi:hypothetical protein